MNIFIISWSGQHENAIIISSEILEISKNVTIVYSDPEPNIEIINQAACSFIRRPNDLFWGDKFKTCLNASDNDGVLVIHADCTCNNWTFLVKRCMDVSHNIKNIGVWAPQIEGTFWNLRVSGMFQINNSELILSAMTDGIVFYLSNQIVERMRKVNYDSNKFGWGIDSLFCSVAHTKNKLVVIDRLVKVTHPQEKTGYSRSEAEEQMNIFLNEFSLMERIKYELLTKFVFYNHEKINQLNNI